ncbi:MAG: hypothetical protein EBS36_04020 [Actinobacteria bacterium]|nr:hypothetical protein [Actinomycetota bacterium]
MTLLRINYLASKNIRSLMVGGVLFALILSVLVVAVPSTPAKAAGGTGTWGNWTIARPNGTLNLNVGGFTSPSANFTTTATGLSVSSGASAWLNSGTLPGAEYGTSRGSGYISMGTATGGADSVTTFTFNNTTPTSGWSFSLGDIDADQVTISATDASGNPVNVGAWNVTPFNYCNNTAPRPTACAGVSNDLPTWDLTTGVIKGNGSDTDGASAWVRPNSAIKTLRLQFKKLIGFPTYQLWFAGDTPEEQNYKVTLAARLCPTYSDIMANKARNNIMESLQNVGINSLYASAPYAGAVRPEVEDNPASGQSACTPLSNWTFGMAQGTNGKDSGTFGALSKVRSPYQWATTVSSVPELDAFGNDTGRTISGAITFNLTPAQITGLANRSSWVQGGVPGSPLNGNSSIAFGTLRCAIDNANADNIEWLGTSGGSRHMFCYAYYVDTTEKSGTIIVRKVVPKGGSGVSFGFSGDLSFTPGGAFSLNAGGSQSFIRAAGETWNVLEDSPKEPFELTGLACNSSNGLSTVDTNLVTRSASITLGIADTVTCTFTNESKPKSKLTVYKVATGAVGTFGFDLSQGGTSKYSGNTAVSEQGEEALVTEQAGLAPGTYTITETSRPSTPGGTWDTPSITCVDSTGAEVTSTGDVLTGASITLSGSDTSCIVVNNFSPDAKINIVNKIIGGSGSISADASFVTINGLTRSERSDTLTNIVWGDGGAQTSQQSGLAFGTYEITGAAPTNTDTSTWELDSLDCTGGASHSISESNVSLELDPTSVGTTEITCTYVWKLTNLADITVSKISLGEVGTFTLTAELNGEISEGVVTTNEVNSATEAITLTTIPEGTVITLGESDVPISTDGQWNVTTGGSPTWTCTDTAGNDVVIDDSGQFTSTALNMTCVATNTFTLDPDPEPTPDPSESYDPEIAYSRGGELPNTGGSKHPMSLWATLWSAITSPFQN